MDSNRRYRTCWICKGNLPGNYVVAHDRNGRERHLCEKPSCLVELKRKGGRE